MASIDRISRDELCKQLTLVMHGRAHVSDLRKRLPKTPDPAIRGVFEHLDQQLQFDNPLKLNTTTSQGIPEPVIALMERSIQYLLTDLPYDYSCARLVKYALADRVRWGLLIVGLPLLGWPSYPIWLSVTLLVLLAIVGLVFLLSTADNPPAMVLGLRLKLIREKTAWPFPTAQQWDQKQWELAQREVREE